MKYHVRFTLTLTMAIDTKPLTQEQLEALRAVPLGAMPNKLRIALAITKAKQSEIVEATGIPAPNVSNIVNGRYGSLMIGTARKLAEYFGCSIEDLFPASESEQRQAVAR